MSLGGPHTPGRAPHCLLCSDPTCTPAVDGRGGGREGGRGGEREGGRKEGREGERGRERRREKEWVASKMKGGRNKKREERKE